MSKDGFEIRIIGLERKGSASSALYGNKFDVYSPGQMAILIELLEDMAIRPEVASTSPMFTTGKGKIVKSKRRSNEN